jgi:hypothetical protein
VERGRHPADRNRVAVGPTSIFNVLAGTAAVATDEVWAVGYFTNGNAIETLIERYSVP